MPNETHITPLARAYAQSVLELAEARNIARPIGEELERLADIVESDPAVRTFFASPAVAEADRARVIDRTFQGRVSELVLNTLRVMNRKGRLNLIAQVARGYVELLEQKMGIIEVDVFVAKKLTPEQLEDVRRRVGAALRREAVVHQYVDPSVIGGLVLRIEDKLLDASVRAQLRAVRRKLLGARRG